ncbi:MAG: ABC transporter permease [Terriglobales bacterium]
MLQDLRYALRQMWKSPGFTTVAVLTLALGIGANTAIFSVVNAVLLRALPYPNPDRLRLLWSSTPSQGLPMFGSSPVDYREWRSDNHSFEGMGAFSNSGISMSLEGHAPEMLISSAITASLFPTMGVKPFLGQGFTERNEQWGEHRVAILSYGLWERSFGSDPNVVGRQVHLGGELYTIAGVMPKAFRFFRRPVVIWTPLAFAPHDEMNTRGNHFVWVVGRLKPGVTVQQADSDLNVIAARIAKEFPENVGLGVRTQSFRDRLVGNVRPALLAIFGAVVFVLLVACVNLANLVLTRAAARTKEFAVRSAMGASRARLVRQFVSESILIAILGGAAGLFFGAELLRMVTAVLPATFPTVQTVSLDPYVLGFTGLLALGSVLLFGIVPALEASRANPQQALHESGRSSTQGRRTRRFRNGLIITEMALATALLAGAGLLIKSFSHLQHQDFGFEAQRLLTFELPLDDVKYPKPEKAIPFIDQVVSRVQQLPGVQAVGIVDTLPLGNGMGWGKNVSGEGFLPMRTMADVPNVQFNLISADYFKAMGARLQAGRAFAGSDVAKSQPVAIVNEAFARRFYPNQNVIGKTIRMLPPPELIPPPPANQPPEPVAPNRTVVGMVGDLKNTEANEPADPEVFVPFTQFEGEGWGNAPMFAVRTDQDPATLASAIRNVVAGLDSQQPVAAVRPMTDLLERSVAQSRFNAMLLAIFAGMALLLAAIGIYGVISYGVSIRTQEIGVRMALGADRRSVVSMVLAESLKLVGLGLLGGLVLALALALTRLIASLLFGVHSADPMVYGAISLVLFGAALLATLLPARRASALEPMQALRAE